MYNRVLVLGLGNAAHSDDGVGVHVINCLRHHNHLINTELVLGNSPGYDLVRSIENTDCLIVIDMTEMNAMPGKVRVFEGIEMDAFIACHDESAGHESGLKNALKQVLKDGRLPDHRALVGIQPGCCDDGDTLTEDVARAVPYACSTVYEIVENWKI